MGLDSKDLERNMQLRAEVIDPDAFDTVTDLHQRNIGRAITTGEEFPENPSTSRLAGYILPLDFEQLSHLVILVNGRILIIGPSGRGSKVGYKDQYSPSEVSNYFYQSHTFEASLMNIEREITRPGYVQHSRLMHSSYNPEDQSVIESAMETAFSLAETLRQRRLATQDKLTRSLRFRAGLISSQEEQEYQKDKKSDQPVLIDPSDDQDTKDEDSL